jgi:predicted nucleic acid-binding protein
MAGVAWNDLRRAGVAVIAVDTNLLVYAHRRESDLHEAAYAVLRSLAEGDMGWAIPWACCYEFFSIVKNRRIWKEAATPPEQAWQQLEAWTASPCNHLIGETDDFLEILGSLVQRPRVRGGIVHDARIAAICLAHGTEVLLNRDRDFALIPELITRDPFNHQ